MLSLSMVISEGRTEREKSMKAQTKNPHGYALRVLELEAEGMTTSDAQSVVDAELERKPAGDHCDRCGRASDNALCPTCEQIESEKHTYGWTDCGSYDESR